MKRRAMWPALILAVMAAAASAGWSVMWAYYTVPPAWFWGFTAGVVVAVLGTLGWRLRRASRGRHAVTSATRDEETAAMFAAMGRPAEVAAEPPGVYLPAPATVPSLQLDHDEYAPAQSWDDHEDEAWAGMPAPDLAVAVGVVTALVALRGLIEAHVADRTGQAEAEAQRLRDEFQGLRDKIQRLEDARDFPHLVRPWVDDTGSFTRKDAELVRAMEQAGEVA